MANFFKTAYNIFYQNASILYYNVFNSYSQSNADFVTLFRQLCHLWLNNIVSYKDIHHDKSIIPL